MNADAWAIVAENGELVVCRTTKEAAEKMRDSFYPGCAVKPLLLAGNDKQIPQEVV